MSTCHWIPINVQTWINVSNKNCPEPLSLLSVLGC